MIKPQKFKATVSYKERISSKVYDVRFKLLEPTTMEYSAGQTVMINISPGINRSMSIASSPKNSTELLICWDVSPMGPGAHWLLDRTIGDEVTFMGPLGAFVFDEESPRRAVFVATGTGVSPFRGYLDTYLEQEKMKETWLYWGLRHEDDMFWHDVFSGYSQRYSNFHYQLTLSQPSSAWQGLTGRVTHQLFSTPIDKYDTDYYLCGSGAMVKEVTEKLLAEGVPDKQVKRELFFS